MLLSEKQVDFVADYLTKCIGDSAILQEEFLDHICCAVEHEMKNGALFHRAMEVVIADFSKETLQQIEQDTIHLLQKNNKTMMKIASLTLLACLLTFTTIWAVKFDPPSGFPVSKITDLSSEFGMRNHPIYKKKMMHLGIDIKLPVGTPILSTSGGIVSKVERAKKGYGYLIVIQHDEIYETKYAQLSEIKVEVGQKVNKGQVIALSGNSGTSTGPHLHYEVLKNGKAVDPKPYLQP